TSHYFPERKATAGDVSPLLINFAERHPNARTRKAQHVRGGQTEVRAFNRQVGFTPDFGHGFAAQELKLCAQQRKCPVTLWPSKLKIKTMLQIGWLIL